MDNITGNSNSDFYDDRELRQLFDELSEKERLRAFRGAFRAEARRVAKAVERNINPSRFRDKRQLKKCIRAIVWRRSPGFRVTVGEKKQLSKQERNKRQKLMERRSIARLNHTAIPPDYKGGAVLRWLDTGTTERHTKEKGAGFVARHLTSAGLRKNGGRRRGRIQAGGFMAASQRQEAPRVTDSLHRHIVEYVRKTALKHGCK